MHTKHYSTAILILATILFTSCSSSQYVIYSLAGITPSDTIKTIPINVNMKMLTDNRANNEDFRMLFSANSRKAKNDNKVFCFNVEKYYKDIVSTK